MADDEKERKLRRALKAKAVEMKPSKDGLAKIRGKIKKRNNVETDPSVTKKLTPAQKATNKTIRQNGGKKIGGTGRKPRYDMTGAVKKLRDQQNNK